jgi:nitric oxide dioxygenase
MLSGNIKVFELLKRSYPLIKKYRLEIGDKTYSKMFDEHPDLAKLFKKTLPGQSQRLVDAILFYCQEVDNYEKFYDQLDKIAHVHIKVGIKNEYYPYMKSAFVSALREVLKEKATDELVRAWQYGFDSLSNELIHIENLIRKYSNPMTPIE